MCIDLIQKARFIHAFQFVKNCTEQTGTFLRVPLSIVNQSLDIVSSRQPIVIVQAHGLGMHLLGFHQGAVRLSRTGVFFAQLDPCLVILVPKLVFAA